MSPIGHAAGPPDTPTAGGKPDEVLEEEWYSLFGTGNKKSSNTTWLHARSKTALCLSGGGIRSAAFSLGVLQVLARQRLLTKFHYLSSVSGGGYVAAWLTQWIASERAKASSAVDPNSAEARVEQKLGARPVAGEDADEPVPRLRRFTNYLTPTPGLASADTWMALTLAIRNLIVNWLMFLPFFLAISLLPLLYDALLGMEGMSDVRSHAWMIGLVLLGVSTLFACMEIPTHGHRDPPAPGLSQGIDGKTAWIRIVLPATGWSLLAPFYFIVRDGGGIDTGQACDRSDLIWYCLPTDYAPIFAAQSGYRFPVSVVEVMVLAFVLAALFRPGHWQTFLINLPYWLLGCAINAGLLRLGLMLAASAPSLRVVVVLAPLWVMSCHVLQSTIYLGLRQRGRRADLDREWLARINGSKLAVAVALSAILASVLLLPGIFSAWQSTWHVILVVFGFLTTGPAAALIGKSPLTQRRGQSQNPLLATGLLAASIIFGATLLAVLGRLGAWLAQWLAHNVPDRWLPVAVDDRLIVAMLALAIGSATLSWCFGLLIPVNRFSLHGIYRNRLVRAFPGSARVDQDERSPDAYTGFDPGDNPRLTNMWKDGKQRSLFPVINMTLNIVADVRPAWTERKAVSFTATPLRCGSALLLRKDSKSHGAYAKTKNYGGRELENESHDEHGRELENESHDEHGRELENESHDEHTGMTLGTAMAISGAAAAPAMGYHTNPATAFLMTLFNVRLGAWMPNPAHSTRTGLGDASPRDSLAALLSELFGLANAKRRSVYLSDGGHFDNLGLYEMLRRRCEFIVVVDATADNEYSFTDLGLTLRRAAIDLGVVIDFPNFKLGDAGAWTGSPNPLHATITYPAAPAGGVSAGKLLYLKSRLPTDTPPAIYSFKCLHQDFPHDSTVHQFFTESQFESYRALGELVATAAFPTSDDLKAAFVTRCQNPVTAPCAMTARSLSRFLACLSRVISRTR